MTGQPLGPGRSDDEAAVVASFSTREEAESAQEMLETAGIASLLIADDVGGTLPSALIGHMVLVSPGELEKAREILDSGGFELREGEFGDTPGRGESGGYEQFGECEES